MNIEDFDVGPHAGRILLALIVTSGAIAVIGMLALVLR